MSTKTLKSTFRRSGLLVAAFALVAATIAPAASTYADALNPLTNRSLTLSSSSPGWDFTDGSGNATYAPPNSGANGQKTGNTFDFRVSSTANVKTFSFQYCTYSAGICIAPGNNSGTHPTRGADTASTSDLNVVTSTPTEVSSGNFATVVDSASGDIKAVPGHTNPSNPADNTGPYAANAITQNFTVYRDVAGTWTQSTGWTMSALSVEDTPVTGKNNYIILTNATGQSFTAGQRVKVVFFGTENNYITNPGAGAFFVKINTYSQEYNASPTLPQVNLSGLAPASDDNVIDGGVTVANVMNRSIHITTKVLETMDFSVGTVDPYTLEAIADAGNDEDETSQLFLRTGNRTHNTCDPILQGMDPLNPSNTLQLGSEVGEFSLETAHTYSTHSYWRLSSNSSAGATVYYSGVTLKNTVGDEITAINNGNGVKIAPARGMEQFGLAMANNTAGVRTVNYNTEREPVDDDDFGLFENGADNLAAGLSNPLAAGIHSSVTDPLISNVGANASWHTTGPQLAPLAPLVNYSDGAGIVNPEYGGPATTQFAFDTASNTIPTPFATGTEVVDCVTGKMRYIANIAATTPAGIYTTKINYIAAPQY